MGKESLFQASAQRLSGAGFAAPVILTGSDFRFIVTEQLAAVEIAPSGILIEPEGRNTAPAILAAALSLAARAPEALMLVAPSDHVIPDPDAFRAAVQAATPAAQDGQLVTFGIRPDRAEIGYGWLEMSEAPSADFAPIPQPLKRFVEKPDRATADTMLNGGQHLWNAGIFLFSVKTIIAAFEAHAPDMLAQVRMAVEQAEQDRMRPAWSCRIPPRRLTARTPYCAPRSPSNSWSVSIIGVAIPDAVLVAHKDRAQDVKKAVAALKAKGATQAETLPRDYRPWGWFESLLVGSRFQVKRIVVHPGAALSLQSHYHGSEHWIVVEGTARVTVGDEVKLVTENQSVYIPLGATHRMENPGKVPMVLIEVQTGSYLGEDDIIRYEDVYARGQGAKG